MPTLAPKLPWQHAFAGGYPLRGGQPLPTDPDAIDYLNRVAAADGGASVEVGIAQAIEAFIVGCKADNAGYAGDPTRSNWDAIKSACILCGARTLSGALVSLKSYGDELVDIDNLPTPIIQNFGGSDGEWDAESNLMQNLVTATDNSYPRFLFLFADMAAGKTYRVTGVLSGDVARIRQIRLATGGAANDVAYNQSTGVFSGLVTAATGGVQFIFDGSLGTASVTIESLSIKEYFANPTNVANNFVEADYSRSGATPGLKGNGSTKYLDTNRAGNADGQNDAHLSVFITQGKTAATVRYAGWLDLAGGTRYTQLFSDSANTAGFVNSTTPTYAPTSSGINFFGISRGNPSSQDVRLNGASQSGASSSVASSGVNAFVFARSYGGSPDQYFDGRLAFYSVGAALDLAKMDTRVTNLVTAIRFHTLTGLLPNDYDPATIAYIVSGISAGGTL